MTINPKVNETKIKILINLGYPSQIVNVKFRFSKISMKKIVLI